jgi:hypothetical protein
VRPVPRIVFVWLVLVLLAVGCTSGSSTPAGTAAEVADKTFAAANVEPFGDTVALTTPQEIEFFLGSTNYPAFTDTAVVQPPISIDARILYILQVATEKDAAAVVKQLEVDVDPARLICVTFSMDDVVIDSRGTVVFMVIDANSDERNALAEAFKTIK